MRRRDALKRLGLGSAAILALPASMPAGKVSPLAGLADLARKFRKVPRTEILDVAAAAIKAGAGYRSILGASFLAGVHDVRPRHVGGKLHCVMMIEAAFQMCEALPEKEGLLLALWSVDDFKRSQAVDRSEGDWELPPRPEVAYAGEAAARKEFLAAMESWDDEKADRAIVGLIPFHDLDSIYELLWVPSARSFGSLGHKIIYGAQLHRVIGRIGWENAEPVLRSLVRGLLFLDRGRQLDAFERTVKAAPSLPGGWLKGKEDVAGSAAIARKLRDAGANDGQQIVIDAFKSGLGPHSVWDGLRLAASEIFARRFPGPPNRGKSLLPVHAVTEVNAFGHAFRATGSDETKRLMTLQAAGWLPGIRQAMDSRGYYDKKGPELDRLPADFERAAGGAGKANGKSAGTEKPSAGNREARFESIFESREGDRARSVLERDRDKIGPFKSRMQAYLTGKGVEHHQHKYAGAFLEESELVDPVWSPAILAYAVNYLPTSAVSDTDTARRSVAALRKAGVI